MIRLTDDPRESLRAISRDGNMFQKKKRDLWEGCTRTLSRPNTNTQNTTRTAKERRYVQAPTKLPLSTHHCTQVNALHHKHNRLDRSHGPYDELRHTHTRRYGGCVEGNRRKGEELRNDIKATRDLKFEIRVTPNASCDCQTKYWLCDVLMIVLYFYTPSVHTRVSVNLYGVSR
jgi:hypothetical protein